MVFIFPLARNYQMGFILSVARTFLMGFISAVAHNHHKGKKETTIAEILNISRATVSNIKKRYREEGLQSALTEKPRPEQPQKYTERHEAEIIAQACTKSPDGKKRWSLTLLTEEMRKREGFETINRESIRLILKKAKQSRG
jgi:putative transposase